MPLVNLLSTIPFPVESLEEALLLQRRIEASDCLVETRADRLQIVQAHPEDFSDNRWYVVVHTGNIRGMIHDLVQEGFL